MEGIPWQGGIESQGERESVRVIEGPVRGRSSHLLRLPIKGRTRPKGRPVGAKTVNCCDSLLVPCRSAQKQGPNPGILQDISSSGSWVCSVMLQAEELLPSAEFALREEEGGTGARKEGLEWHLHQREGEEGRSEEKEMPVTSSRTEVLASCRAGPAARGNLCVKSKSPRRATNGSFVAPSKARILTRCRANPAARGEEKRVQH